MTMLVHLLQGLTRDNRRLVQLLHGWGIEVQSSADTAAFISNAYNCSVNARAPDVLLIDMRGRPENADGLLSLLRNSPRLGGLRYLLITDTETATGEVQQQAYPGYDAVIHSPLDKILLFNALHAHPDKGQHGGVTSLLDHYVRAKSALPPLEILVAIGSQVQLKVVRRQIARNGHHVYTASSGELALDAMTTHHFDVAILDMALDDMDGLEVARLYRMTLPEARATPIVMLASDPNAEMQQRCEDAGVVALLGLPLELQKLEMALRRLLARDDASPRREPVENRPLPYLTAPQAQLDLDTLRELEALGEGLGFIRELVDRFISDSNELLQAMRAAVTAQDLEGFRDFATALKGSSGSVGGVHLQRFCIRLAAIGRADYLSNAERLLEWLHAHLQATQSALLSYIDERSGQASRR